MKLPALVIPFALLATPALADQITIGASPANAYDIAGTGGGHPLAVTGVPFDAAALFGTNDVGTAAFGAVAFSTGPVNSGVFPVLAGGLQSLDVSFADGDSIAGTVTWAEIDDGSLNPHLAGSYAYTASGDPAFLASFGAAGDVPVDAIVATVPQTLESWDTDAGIQLSAMEITADAPTLVPEPTTLALLGMALIGFGDRRRTGLLRSRSK